jgi:hypothetical protein
MTESVERRTSHVLGALALASVLALAACGSGASPTGAPAPGQTSNQGGQGSQGATGAGRFGGQGGRGFPGASGLVADVTGSTAQVQSPQSQTAVTWTKSTRFTAQLKTTAAQLRVGDCVTARPARQAGTPGSTGTPAPSATDESNFAAATVEIFPATNGDCSVTGLAGVPGGGGFGGGGFGNRTGAPGATTPPRGTGAPNGGNGFGGQARGTFGKVTALSGGSFTVDPVARRAANGTATTASSPVTVTYAATTTFTSLGSAAASAVKVGVCVTALGKTDDTGAVTATSIQVSQPVGGSCTTGFRLGGGAGRPGATTTGAPNA